MERACRRRARPRLRGAVRRRTDRRRVELRRAGHTRLPVRPVQARHGAPARIRRGPRRGERCGGADRSRMPRGGVGDATGTVPELPAPPPRVRGENARLAQQKETIEEELDTAVDRPGDSRIARPRKPMPPKYAGCRGATRRSPRHVQAATTARLEADSPPAPPFCADARAWAQSGYRALSAASREFEASRAARRSAERGRSVPLGTLLKPYENASDRALIRKTDAVGRQAPCQRLCHRADAFQPGSDRRVPAMPEPKNPSRSPWVMGAPPPVPASK